MTCNLLLHSKLNQNSALIDIETKNPPFDDKIEDIILNSLIHYHNNALPLSLSRDELMAM